MLSGKIAEYRPCEEAVEWLNSHRSFQQAWDNCERGDWMLWLLSHTADKTVTARVACQCARLSLEFVPAGELRPLQAIETTEAWCDGRATLDEVKTSSSAAYCASITGYAAASAYSASACFASDCTACNAYLAASNAAYACKCPRLHTLKRCADIVRDHVPWCPVQYEI